MTREKKDFVLDLRVILLFLQFQRMIFGDIIDNFFLWGYESLLNFVRIKMQFL